MIYSTCMLWGDQEIRGDSEDTRLRILLIMKTLLHDLLVRQFDTTSRLWHSLQERLFFG